MESKIQIDINYASRSPQIVLHFKESDDPRDKLVTMLTGEAMPGVREGYCQIERYAGQNGIEISVITPIHPVKMLNHIPVIARLAEENGSIDTSDVPGIYCSILDLETERVRGKYAGVKSPSVDKKDISFADEWLADNLPPALYKKWSDEFLYNGEPPNKSSQR